MKIGIDFTLTVQWVDDRLNKIKPTYKHRLIQTQDLWQRFWFPITDFGNHLVCDSEPDVLYKSPDSRMVYYPETKYLKLEFDRNCNFSCEYDLFKYPLDTQKCPVELREIKHGKRKVKLIGKVQSPRHTERVILPPEWQLLRANISDCKRLVGVNCIQFTITIKRLISHHVMTFFIPSFLVVTISWISFTLNVEQIAPRVTLGLTTWPGFVIQGQHNH